jgi:NADP-dependent alcohol dehydrogenase
MQNFVLYNPTKLIFGAGQIEAVGREIPKEAKVLMTYGGGSIKANGVYEQVKNALAGHTVLEFGGIEPNPCYETLMNAVHLARAEKVDFLLAVGGGSTLDGTKFIAAAIPFEGDPWEILRGARPKTAMPLASVMTLPATGSEMNCGAVISRKSTLEKFAFSSPMVFPRFSVVDPETTYSLPPRQITNGVVDAFVHVLEQYLTYPADAPIQDRFAEGILQTLLEVGPRTLADPKDYSARSNMVFSATMALNGLIGVGVPQDWITHMIGHELTILHGLDHAQTLAIVAPNLMWVQRKTKWEKLLQFADRVWGIREGGEAQRVEQAIIKTRTFFESMGNPTHLSDYGLGDGSFDEIVRRFKGRNMLPCGEKKDLDEVKLREILAMCR